MRAPQRHTRGVGDPERVGRRHGRGTGALPELAVPPRRSATAADECFPQWQDENGAPVRALGGKCEELFNEVLAEGPGGGAEGAPAVVVPRQLSPALTPTTRLELEPGFLGLEPQEMRPEHTQSPSVWAQPPDGAAQGATGSTGAPEPNGETTEGEYARDTVAMHRRAWRLWLLNQDLSSQVAELRGQLQGARTARRRELVVRLAAWAVLGPGLLSHAASSRRRAAWRAAARLHCPARGPRAAAATRGAHSSAALPRGLGTLCVAAAAAARALPGAAAAPARGHAARGVLRVAR